MPLYVTQGPSSSCVNLNIDIIIIFQLKNICFSNIKYRKQNMFLHVFQLI